MVFKRFRKSLRDEKGFTILELIVVIAIMGFLIALIAPKLSDVAENSHGNISLTNLQRLNEAVGRYVTDSGKLPDKLGDGTWKYKNPNPMTWNIAKANEKLSTADGPHGTNGTALIASPNDKIASLHSRTFIERHGIVIHDLTEDEANDIKKLGINTLIDYQENKEVPVAKGCKVLIIGVGGRATKMESQGGFPPKYKVVYDTPVSNDMKQVNFNLLNKNHFEVTRTDNPFKPSKIARPELIYRIVLAIGEESSIAKSGYLKNIGMDPSVADIKDYVKMTEYGLVLPRLQSTIKRLDTNIMPMKIKVNGFDKDGESTGQQKTVDISKVQTIEDFTILGQGKEVYPISDVYEWEIDTLLNKDGKAIATDQNAVNTVK